MGEQHYGTAPCGCERWRGDDPDCPYAIMGKPFPVAHDIVKPCGSHAAVRWDERGKPCSWWIGNSEPPPMAWHAAQSLEQGLRAIRTWPWYYTISLAERACPDHPEQPPT